MSKCKCKARPELERAEMAEFRRGAANIPTYEYDPADPYACSEYDPRYGNNPESCRARGERMLPSASMIPLATAYVRPQEYGNIFTPCDCLKNGTCFPELAEPYAYEEECYV